MDTATETDEADMNPDREYGKTSRPPAYRVERMRREDGRVAEHFLNGLAGGSDAFASAMDDPGFAEIIANELRTERIADEPLDPLARQAPTDRVRRSFERWLAFIDGDLQPWTTGGAIHFRPHWARVLMLSLVMADLEDLAEEDARALAMAAAFHDSRRKDPYLDTGHGARAAAYYARFCRDTRAGVQRNTPAGARIVFDPRTYLAVKWHDRDDDAGLEAIAEAIRCNALPELGIDDLASLTPPHARADAAALYRMFKDADGLDRVRLGPQGLDERFLRTVRGKALVPFARKLLDASENAGV